MNDSSLPNGKPRAGIDQISTRWPLIQDPVKFVMRYAPAMRGYLGVFLKNEHDVDDVCQAILLRIVERGVVEEHQLHGRFRDYLIATVRNAALSHLRRRPDFIPDATPISEIPDPRTFEFPSDEEWLSRWRRVVMASAWEALELHERSHPGNLGFTVLRVMVDHPEEDSTQLAARVSKQCGRPLQPEAFRKQVSRARRHFAEILVADIVSTLDDPSPLKVEEELIEIGVMKYVRPFLPADWRSSGKFIDGD